MYTYTWKKYLPVIRLLLKRSASAEQLLTLNRTDFEKSTKLRKPVVSFSIEIINGRLRTLNPPVQAKDLLEILLQDSVADGLLRKKHYAITFSSDFQLSIKNLTPPEEAPAAEPADAEGGSGETEAGEG